MHQVCMGCCDRKVWTQCISRPIFFGNTTLKLNLPLLLEQLRTVQVSTILKARSTNSIYFEHVDIVVRGHHNNGNLSISGMSPDLCIVFNSIVYCLTVK